MYTGNPIEAWESPDIGSGTRIWANVHILDGAKIGERCNIGEGCYIESQVIIGDDVVVKNGVCLWDGITLQNKVFVAPGVIFTNDRYPRTKAVVPEFEPEPTLVEEGASIGAGAVVVAGITIGEYAMIGAGSVVTADVPAFALVYGNPARVHGYLCVCTKKLSFNQGEAACSCGRKFLLYRRYNKPPLIVMHKEPESGTEDNTSTDR